MTMLHAIHLLALVTSPALGLIVFWTNRQRIANNFFLIFCAIMTLWLACLNSAFYTDDLERAGRYIRLSCMVTVFAAYAFNGLRISLMRPRLGLLDITRETWPLLAAAIAVFVMCSTRFFLEGVRQSPGASIPEPIYGPSIVVYAAYHLSALTYLVVCFIRDARRSEGIVRTEIQFVMLGSGVGIGFAVLSAVIVPLVTSGSQSVQYAPLAAVAVEFVIAYGIATRRIMEVSHILRRLSAYSLLGVYLTALYVGVWYVFNLAAQYFDPQTGHFLPHLIAALSVAFSMAPAHGYMQNFANKLFVSVQSLDVSDTIQKANRILGSISTIDDLLAQFSKTIAQAVGTDRVVILLSENNHYSQCYPKPGATDGIRLDADDPILVTMDEMKEPLVSDVLDRIQPSPTVAQAARGMAKLQSAVAVGIQSKTKLDGIMLLGPRLSGRIYGAQEQRALQILCNNLAVALENAKLYTQVQDSAIYNNILLDNLVSGVIAVGSERVVTVFNREAQRITRLDPEDVLHKTIESLPYPLAQALGSTFESGTGVRDFDVVLHLGDKHDEVPVRLGTALFRSQTGKVPGALLVFNDLSTLRKLELQVRRTDRLASLGTLSAGMAHEIKNPLVTLKTFTQLLPDRYDDPDFRETFSGLLGQEVKRIDSLVNQLLRFARPTKPSLAPMHLHAVVENTLKLVLQQMRQKGLVMSKSLDASTDLILGDNDLLVQALLNFLLNAIDAMEDRNELMVTTNIEEYETEQVSPWGQPVTESVIRLSIRDTGAGIKPEDIPHVFDPFFTTKSTGTGLGLSVAHGIIHEHHGVIDVESTLGLGTTFHIILPLARKEATI